MKPIKLHFWQCCSVVAILVPALLLSIPSFSQEGWTLANPSPKVIRDMESLGRDLYAVGDQGLILKRNGSVETIFNPGVTTNFKAITLISTNSILAVGADKVVRSTDGGTTWSVATIAGSPSLTDVIMQNTTTGWVVGLAGKIFKTTDGGATWTAQTSNTTNALNSVIFMGSSVVAVGANRTVCRSTNGGTTWTLTTPGLGTVDFRSIGGIPGGDLIIVGTNRTILTSTDDGATWTTRIAAATINLNRTTTYYDASVNNGTACCPNFGIYASGDGGVLLKSEDQGASWVSVPSGRTDDITAIEGAVYYEGPGATLSGGDIFLGTSTKGIMKSVPLPCAIAPSATAISNITACIGDDVVIPVFGSNSPRGVMATRSLKKSGVVVDFDGNTNALTTMTLSNIQPSQAGTYTIEVTNACGSLTSTPFTITVNDVPAMPSVITGSATPVQSIINTYSVINVVGNTYAWNGGTNATTSPSANTATISWTTTGLKTITVTPTNACGTGPARTLDVTVQAPILSPAYDAVNVPVSSNLTITFGTPVQLTNTETITIYRNADNSVFETYTIPSTNVTNSGGVVTINPTANFDNSVVYRVNIDTRTMYHQVDHISYYPPGTLGSNTTIFRFTTAAAADVIPPTISSFSPTDNATNVAISSNLVATFSENVTAVATKGVSIRRTSDNAVFESYTLPSSNVVVSGTTVTINPTGSLANSTGYYVNMDAGAFEDGAGNDFAGILNNSTWNFTTVAAADVTPPTISTLSPLDNATDVAIASNLVATFSENVSAVATKVVSIRRSSDNAVFESYTLPSGNVVVSGTSVTINPTGSLANSTGYYVNMEAGAFEDAAGNDFAGIVNNSTWNLTTVAPADVTPPTVNSYTPLDNSTDVAIGATLFCNFSESILAVATKVVSIKRTSDNAIFESYTLPSANVTIAGTDLIINPTASLLNSTGYYVSIDIGAFEDAAGNDFAGITNTTAWNFTTVAAAPQNQTITFSPLAAKTFGDAAFALTATASSGLTVSYTSSNTSVATVSGSTVTIVGAGSTIITASQAGNGSFNAAADVQQTLTVNKANQTITFGALAAKTFGDANFALGATSSSSLGVSYTSSNTAVATISGSTVTIVGAGSTTITASQAGNANFNAATPVDQVLTVNKASQTITFGALAAKTFGDANFALGATASSALGVSYTSSNTSVATVSGSTVTIVGAGSTTITASQVGNANFNAATPVDQVLTVNKASQTITFGALAAKTFGDANFVLGATASSALGVSYTSSNTSVATVSGSTVTIVGAGSTTITASQAGNANYNAAANVPQTLTVNKANQTITFGALPGKQVGDSPFALTATSSSGLAISYASSNTGVATISGSTLTVVGVGSSTITASQSGNANYNAASPVNQSFTVTSGAPPMAIQSVTPPDNATAVDGATNLAITFNQNVDISTGTISVFRSDNDALITQLSNAGPWVTISGATATFDLSANLPAGTDVYVNISAGYLRSAADGSNTFAGISNKTTWNFTVGKLSQSITFGALPAKAFGDANFNLFATASSGLSVSYASSEPTVATVSGNTVTIVGVGSTTITATQSGNATYNAATPVNQVLTVGKANQTIAFGALSAKTFGDGNFSLSASSTSGLSVSYSSSNAAVATVSGNTVTIIGAGSATITASQSGNANFNAAPNVNQTLTVNKASQTISFGALAAKTFGDANFNLSATATSGLPVAYASSNTAVATVSGNTVTIVGAGSATITASQSGNTNYDAAANVNQILTVNKASQTITFGALAAKAFGDANFNLSATASSGLGVSYTSSNTAVATVSGNTVTIVGAGSTTITASQSGNTNYNAAANVNQSLTVGKSGQTLTFTALTAKTFGDAAFDLSATATSGLAVTYTSSNTAVATISGNTVTIVGAGSADLTATQGGNANYNAATPIVRALTVNKADQTISFGSLTAKGVSDPPFTLSATASSGLSVSYASSNSAVATVSGNTVTIVGQGTTTITASQGGNANYNAASSVGQTLTVNAKQGQTITFGALAAKTIGDAAFTLSASASSGLAVTFTSSNTAVATVSGNTVTLVGPGSTTITASQAGDATYNPATSVQQTLVVNKASQTITFSALESKQLSIGTFDLTATASSGLAVSFTSSNTSVATVSGTTVTLLSAGTTTITAAQTGNANYEAAPSVDQLLTVLDKQTQTITFNALPAKTVGDAAFELTATASSGLAIVYTSSNTSVATISGSTVTIVAAGTTNITASQAGDANYQAAASVVQALVVNAVSKQAQTITFGALAPKTFGDAAFTLTASASSGLPVSYNSSNENVARVSGGTVTIVGAGSAIIKAMQAGNATYHAAAQVEQTLTVNKASQAIVFNALTDRGLTEGAFNLSSTATSGLAVTFTSSNTAVATVSGNTVTPVSSGTVTITASQSGNANYLAATPVSQALTIVDDIPTRIIGVSGDLAFDEVILPATATKTFTISNSGNETLTITSIEFPEGYSGTKTSDNVAAGGTLQVTVTFTPTQAKKYNGNIIITSNATSGAGSLTVTGEGISVTSLDDAMGTKPMSVFPNPGRGVFTLKIHQPQSRQAFITDEVGRVSFYTDLQPLGDDLYQIDITGMSQGVYIIKLPADQKVKMTRLVKID